MVIFQVHHFIRPGLVDRYLDATLENARHSLEEPGVLRFEVFQDRQDPTHFSLFEIYEDEAAQRAHFETSHFKAWRDVYFATRAREGHGNHFIALHG